MQKVVFILNPSKKKSKVVKYSLIFMVSQHSRDFLLMNKILDHLNCGLIETPNGRKKIRYVVYKFSDQLNKIISFFKKYELLSTKRLDFQDFCRISCLLKENNILSEEYILNIQKIKSNMNNKRIV